MRLPRWITFVPGSPLGCDARTFPSIRLGGTRGITINEPPATLETHDLIARRLVACWNACDGISLEALEATAKARQACSHLVFDPPADKEKG